MKRGIRKSIPLVAGNVLQLLMKLDCKEVTTYCARSGITQRQLATRH